MKNFLYNTITERTADRSSNGSDKVGYMPKINDRRHKVKKKIDDITKNGKPYSNN